MSGPAAATGAPELLAVASARGRLTLTAVTIGSGIAILDGSVVNVALKAIGAELGASLTQLQWVVNGYLLALASLVLVGGALGDRLLPLGLFRSRVFSAANAMTLLVYGALGVVLLVLVLQVQVSAGWSALAAGLTSVPTTVALMLLSTWAGRLASRIGPRTPMTVGPLVCAAGIVLLLGAGPGTRWYDVLAGLVLFSLGMALLVSPLTTAVLMAAGGVTNWFGLGRSGPQPDRSGIEKPMTPLGG